MIDLSIFYPINLLLILISVVVVLIGDIVYAGAPAHKWEFRMIKNVSVVAIGAIVLGGTVAAFDLLGAF